MSGEESQFRFDERVVLVTGGSRGLGRAFSKLFAACGATVVISSLGGEDEQLPGLSAAEVTRQEIEAAGGQVYSIEQGVEEAESIINFCQAKFGRLDVLVHNAGIVQDASFLKQTYESWDQVYRVNLEAGFRLSHAAWPLMKAQNYGRLLFITSSAGAFGNFGQANYSAAKLGMVGLSNTLAVEGRRYGILSNCVSPIASTRLNASVLTDKQKRLFKAEDVAPLIAYLCHEDCQETGGLFEAGGGWFAKMRWQRSVGRALPPGSIKIADIHAQWAGITGFSGAEVPENILQDIDFIEKHLTPKK